MDGRTPARAAMWHPLRTLLLEEVAHEGLVADVALVDGQALPVGADGAEAAEVGLLDAHVVVVVHLVDDHDGVAALEEVGGDGGADEAGPAGDEDLLEPQVGVQGHAVA